MFRNDNDKYCGKMRTFECAAVCCKVILKIDGNASHTYAEYPFYIRRNIFGELSLYTKPIRNSLKYYQKGQRLQTHIYLFIYVACTSDTHTHTCKCYQLCGLDQLMFYENDDCFTCMHAICKCQFISEHICESTHHTHMYSIRLHVKVKQCMHSRNNLSY